MFDIQWQRFLEMLATLLYLSTVFRFVFLTNRYLSTVFWICFFYKNLCHLSTMFRVISFKNNFHCFLWTVFNTCSFYEQSSLSFYCLLNLFLLQTIFVIFQPYLDSFLLLRSLLSFNCHFEPVYLKKNLCCHSSAIFSF